MPSSAAICPACQFRVLFSHINVPTRSWQPQRGVALHQRPKPSRMTLSKRVGEDRGGGTGRRNRKDEDDVAGPFQGMNQRVAPIRPLSREISSRARLALRNAGSKSPVRTAASRETIRRRRTASVDGAPSSHEGPVGARGSTAPRDKKDERPVFHALKMQSMLAPLSYSQRDRLKEKLEKIESFDQLGLTPPVVNAVYTQVLPYLTEYAPTPVQKLAIPTLLSKKNAYEKSKKQRATGQPTFDQFLIAAETGSGKTLAYLLPVVDGIKQQEELDKAEAAQKALLEAREREETMEKNPYHADPVETDAQQPDPAMGRPAALILLPSSELVAQVGKVVKLVSHTVKYRSAPISSANTPVVIRNRLFNPRGIDILISTPSLVHSIADKDPNILSRVQYLVIDEADSLLDRSFAPTTTSIIDRTAPSLKQLVLCSATIPNSLDKFLDRRFPEIKRIVTPKLHTIPRRVQLGMIDIDKPPYMGNRDLACASVIWELGKAVHDDTHSSHAVKHILVFVNEREKAEEVATFLESKGIDAVALTRDAKEQRQADVLGTFTSPERVDGEEKADLEQKRSPSREFIPFEDGRKARDGASLPADEERPRLTKGERTKLRNTKVLVTTDLGSRGVDTLAVRHVVLYDVPHSTIDFVHRLGRMGRMNRRGRGVVLVGRKDRKDVVREVREAMHRGQALI